MSGTFSGAGRACDMTLQMSQTAVTSGTATGTFASNLGTVNNAYVFGTASTFMNFSWLSAAGTGPVNPPAFTIPFSATYNYIAPIGNLVWEWRFKNATANTSVPLDAASGSGANLGTLLPSSGTGCTATGKTGPATGTLTTPLVGGDYHLQFDLNNAANSVSAILALGVSNTTSPVGWCAPVISPLVLLPGTTDSNGAWSFSSPLVGLAGSAPFSLFAQYGFDNSGSIGLSDVDGYTSGPIPGALGLTRIYRAAAFSTQTGDELATTGSLGRRYGLVVSWLQ
jgi:hypothetical protein